MIYPKDFVNKTVEGDCLNVLPNIPNEVVDLIYLDPPFGENSIDAPYGLKWRDKQHYINWMRERLIECKRVLKSTGSIYLHCDYHSNAHLRLMMDDIFGVDNFQNEIIWYYRKWTSKQKKYQKRHDTIFFYTNQNDNSHTFNQLYEPLSDNRDDRLRGSVYDKKGKRHTIILNAKSPGVRMSDIWPIPIIPSQSEERLYNSDVFNISKCIGGYLTKKENRISDDGSTYPNQKPIALLKRIIEISSNPGDIVLDPMCGSGTTLHAAHKLNRKFIGIDRIKNTVQLSSKRLAFDLRQRRID